MSIKSKSVSKRVSDDVETLLKATEDELLLNLTINSHTARGASSYLDPDLHRRFESLRSHKGPSCSASDTVREEKDEEDLFARFAALKGSVNVVDTDSSSLGIGKSIESDDEDEVEKVMRWAVDAARLDPAPKSDVDEDDGLGLTSDDEEDHKKVKETKKKRKKKNSKQ